MVKEVLPPEADHTANLDDDQKTYAAFDWKQVEPEFDWFRTERFNMAHECIDRHCRGPRKNKLARHSNSVGGHAMTVLPVIRSREESS